MIQIKLAFTNYVFIAFLLTLLYLSFLVIKPFIAAIISSFAIAFVFYPLYKIILKKIKRENLSAFIVSLIILLIVIVPIIFVINSTSRELLDLYSEVSVKMTQEKDLIGLECSTDTALCSVINAINDNPKIRFYVSGAVTNIVSSFTKNTTAFLFSIPKKIVDVFIIFLIVFFLLQNGEKVWQKTKDLLPLKESHKDKLMRKFVNTINSVVYGYVIISLMEGVIGWFAFFIVGSKMAFMLGIIILITGLLPFIGASIIWVPGALIYFFSGSPIKAAVVFIAGIIIAWLDSWTRAKIIGDRVDIHPAVVIIGAIGGILMFGLVGIIIGPLILSIMISAIEIYLSEKDYFVV